MTDKFDKIVEGVLEEFDFSSKDKVNISEGLKLREEDYSDIEGMNLYEIEVRYFDISNNRVD